VAEVAAARTPAAAEPAAAARTVKAFSEIV